ncbi:MAG: ABC transporter substrate-binding protein, partial [Rhodoglobus sp.]
MTYDAKGNLVNEVAKSISTKDSQHYVVKLNSGWTYSDGSPVKAQDFVAAWNYGALSTNAQLNNYFFAPIAGYDALNAIDAAGNPAPTAKTLSGLKVVSDTEFTIDLANPQSDFPLSLGYTAFDPLPPVAFKDMKAFGEAPIGDGPYKLAKGGWKHNVQVSLIPNPRYSGAQKAKNGGVTFKEYTTPEAAYTDLLAGNLDLLDGFPSNALKTFKQDLPGHYLNVPVANTATLTVPSYLPQFEGAAGLLRRQAISMAIDRQAIIDKIYFGTKSIATEFTSPSLNGYESHIPGNEALKYNPSKAKQLWEQANSIRPWDSSQPLTIAYNGDGAGNKEFIEAITNQIKNTLGIDAEPKPYATFKEFRDVINSHKLDGLARSAWLGDYPSLQDFLGPQYQTGAGANDGGYSNPDFDSEMAKAASAPTSQEGNVIYNKAQAILMKDLPVLPLWYADQQAGWSSNVSHVKLSWSGNILYYSVTT